jgi:hypothetical protein
VDTARAGDAGRSATETGAAGSGPGSGQAAT